MSFGIPSDLDIPWVRTPGTLLGSLRFRRTRVFTRSLFDCVSRDGEIESFLESYPGVSREDASKALFTAGVIIEALPHGGEVGRAEEVGCARAPEVLGGEAVFAGTRVLVAALFDELESGGRSTALWRSIPR